MLYQYRKHEKQSESEGPRVTKLIPVNINWNYGSGEAENFFIIMYRTLSNFTIVLFVFI